MEVGEGGVRMSASVGYCSSGRPEMYLQYNRTGQDTTGQPEDVHMSASVGYCSSGRPETFLQ
jgi:hypothetical protein